MQNKSSQNTTVYFVWVLTGLDLHMQLFRNTTGMKCLKTNACEPIEMLSGKGLLKKVYASCKYFSLFLPHIFVRLVSFIACFLRRLFVVICV
jgi:hypothetical protein